MCSITDSDGDDNDNNDNNNNNGNNDNNDNNDNNGNNENNNNNNNNENSNNNNNNENTENTENPAATDETTSNGGDTSEKKGCGSSIGATFVILATIGVACPAVLRRKRKE